MITSSNKAGAKIAGACAVALAVSAMLVPTNSSAAALGVEPIMAAMTVGAQAHALEAASVLQPGDTVAVGPRPESITRGWGGKLYVSIQGQPDLGLNDGEVRVLDPVTGTVSPFVTGLDNPRGLAFTGKNLVVADTTVVWIIDRSGAKRILAGPSAFPHPVSLLNDAAPADGGRAVYVTEMGARAQSRDANGVLWPTESTQAVAIPAAARTYRISLTGQVTEVVTPSRKGLILNGVTESRRPGHLLVGDTFYGSVIDVDLRTGGRAIVATGFRGADGLSQGRDSSIYVSSFDTGAVWKMDADGENPRTLLLGSGSGTAADFYLDEQGQRIFVPDTTDGTAIVISAR